MSRPLNHTKANQAQRVRTEAWLTSQGADPDYWKYRQIRLDAAAQKKAAAEQAKNKPEDA